MTPSPSRARARHTFPMPSVFSDGSSPDPIAATHSGPSSATSRSRSTSVNTRHGPAAASSVRRSTSARSARPASVAVPSPATEAPLLQPFARRPPLLVAPAPAREHLGPGGPDRREGHQRLDRVQLRVGQRREVAVAPVLAQDGRRVPHGEVRCVRPRQRGVRGGERPVRRVGGLRDPPQQRGGLRRVRRVGPFPQERPVRAVDGPAPRGQHGVRRGDGPDAGDVRADHARAEAVERLPDPVRPHRTQRRRPPGEVARPPLVDAVPEGRRLLERLRRVIQGGVHGLQQVPQLPYATQFLGHVPAFRHAPAI